MINLLKYFITINKHKYYVLKYCIKMGIIWRGITHDLSKFSFKEMFISAKYFNGKYSPIAAEKIEKGYSIAWLHHKGINRHHLEWWIDIEQGEIKLIKPEITDVKEMFADWIAATIVYSKGWDVDKACDYWAFRLDKKFMHKDLIKVFDEIYRKLKSVGLETTVKHIDTIIKENY